MGLRRATGSAREVGLLAGAAMTALAGCAAPRALPPPVTPYDYRDRHPVMLTESPQVLDLFPFVTNGRLDDETLGRLRNFVARYRGFGNGPISLLMPSGGVSTRAAAAGAGAVRRELAAAGLGGVIAEGAYPVADQKLAAPIRLSFKSLKAKVLNRCGEWPRDLASGIGVDGWQNESYWNFGCATQATFSAQVADPRDLANPRGQQPADIEMRMRPVERLRQGADPSTSWGLQGSKIGGVGG